MIAIDIFRNSADFASEARRNKLREAEPVSVTDTLRIDPEAYADVAIEK
jgi:hypothetical protein